MESRYYETIHETGHLQVLALNRVFSPAGVFPAHWHEYVEILLLKRDCFLPLFRLPNTHCMPMIC